MKQTITLGAGCFWGTQAYFDRIPGVLKTSVGYANGDRKTVTYKEVCNEETGFVEACQVTFDDSIISLTDLLEKYWSVVNPTLVNRQGNDIGSQYRTGIYFYRDDEEYLKPDILRSRDRVAAKYPKPVVTEVEMLRNYILAEEYHQKYLEKNPGGYCHIKLD